MKKEMKYVTMPVFEKHQDFMAKSFAKVFEKLEKHDKYFEEVFDKFKQHDKIFETMLKEIQNNSQEAREHRMMMSSLNHSDITQERKIEGLIIRIEKLEEKIK